MIQLDLQSRLPIYEQLKCKIIELVLLEQLKPDDQLPSVRSFSRELGINPNTVQKAYQELERENIIYSVAGRGSYINPNMQLNQQLQLGYLENIRHATQKAKNCGIQQTHVMQVVNEVYQKEEE